jgi:hypothetical protein
VDNYVADLFSDWEVTIAVLAGERLKLPVLRSIATYVPPSKQQVHMHVVYIHIYFMYEKIFLSMYECIYCKKISEYICIHTCIHI